MSDTMTVLPSSFVQKARSNASFLQANYSDLSAAEADVISKKLNECADRIEELERQLAKRDAALARCVEALEIAQDFLTSDKETTLPWDMNSVPLNKIPAALASIPTSAQATAKVLAAARWVPCDEQMPDLLGRDDSHVPGGAPATLYSERVLVFDGTVRIDNLVQAEGSPETRTFYVGSRKPVTHWMPLPEPPEAIREEQEGK